MDLSVLQRLAVETAREAVSLDQSNPPPFSPEAIRVGFLYRKAAVSLSHIAERSASEDFACKARDRLGQYLARSRALGFDPRLHADGFGVSPETLSLPGDEAIPRDASSHSTASDCAESVLFAASRGAVSAEMAAASSPVPSVGSCAEDEFEAGMRSMRAFLLHGRAELRAGNEAGARDALTGGAALGVELVRRNPTRRDVAALTEEIMGELETLRATRPTDTESDALMTAIRALDTAKRQRESFHLRDALTGFTSVLRALIPALEAGPRHPRAGEVVSVTAEAVQCCVELRTRMSGGELASRGIVGLVREATTAESLAVRAGGATLSHALATRRSEASWGREMAARSAGPSAQGSYPFSPT
jgi:hypothetical protein